MDEEDCATALKFWVGKKVLREREDPVTGDALFEIIEDQGNNSDADDNSVDEVSYRSKDSVKPPGLFLILSLVNRRTTASQPKTLD